MKKLLKVILIFLPWPMRRYLLNKIFGYEIHPGAKLGLNWVYPSKLVMYEGAYIAHFTVAIHLDFIQLGRNSHVGRSNWITGFSSSKSSRHFAHQQNRKSELFLGDESAITKSHHIDCTSGISIGKYSTIAGYNSQLLTHSIDIYESRQSSSPIVIGDYTFIGTNVTILGGSHLPDFSVLGAKSLLNKSFENKYMLYAGVPARPIKPLPESVKYFNRKSGFIY